MTEQIILTKEELNQIIDSAILRCQHTEPSKKTQEMFDTLNFAIFGNSDHLGLVAKTDKMYDVFVVGQTGTTLIKWIGAIIISILGVISVLKGILMR